VALRTFDQASPARQTAWEAAYGAALAEAGVQGTIVGLPAGGYGPVAPLLAGLLSLGRSGLLEPAVDNTSRWAACTGAGGPWRRGSAACGDNA